jgi:hypothetical protein
MRRRSIAVAATIIFTLALATVALAADPFVGTWKLSVAKSKFPLNRGQRTQAPPKELTVVIRDTGDQQELTFTGTGMDGSHISSKGTHPLQGGVANPEGPAPGPGRMIVATVIGPGNVFLTFLQNGKQVIVSRYLISKDGKTMTNTIKHVDDKGKLYEDEVVRVFDKQ